MIAIETALLIIIGILLFELIIFVHEFGHFITAKKSGVKVNEFALGMGPRIIKFQKGETIYALRLLPIGGFCAMEGEDQQSDDDRAFGNKPVWKRMIIIVAGAVMNIILGFLLMVILLIPTKLFVTTEISRFSENATSSQQLQSGDVIMSINGYRTVTDLDLSFAFATAKSNDFTFEVVRNGETKTFNHVKFPTVQKEDGKEIIQRDIIYIGEENNFLTLMKQSFLRTVSTVRMVWASLIGLITGQFGFNEVAGPIGMTSAISQAASEGLKTSFWDGLQNVLFIMMIITVNLGVVNLLPLPALDGGRFVFLVIEAIRRKKIKPEVEAIIHAVGIVVLLLFMAVVSVNDIIRLFNG